MKKVISAVCAVMIMLIAAVPAFAVASPEPTKPSYKITVQPSEGGTASYEFTSDVDENGDQGVHLMSETYSGYTFDHWTIDGTYTTDNELTDSDVDIVISSDITVQPVFAKNGSTETTAAPTTPVVKDNGSTSPKTGADDVILYAVILLSAAACGIAVLKLAKSK